MEVDDLETIVRRANKRLPPRPYGLLEGIYKNELLKVKFKCSCDLFSVIFLSLSSLHYSHSKTNCYLKIYINDVFFSLFAHIGFYRQHYVEYLVSEISKAKIDPLPILDLTDCVQELRRRGIALPERGPWDTDEIYKVMCAEVFNIFDMKVFKWNKVCRCKTHVGFFKLTSLHCLLHGL